MKPGNMKAWETRILVAPSGSGQSTATQTILSPSTTTSPASTPSFVTTSPVRTCLSGAEPTVTVTSAQTRGTATRVRLRIRSQGFNVLVMEDILPSVRSANATATSRTLRAPNGRGHPHDLVGAIALTSSASRAVPIGEAKRQIEARNGNLIAVGKHV